MASSTVENYLKQVYLEQQKVCRHGPSDETLVTMGALAAAMQVAPGTATAMVKALADSGLVHYAPRNGVRLTEAGRKLALHVLRRHRLIELFLVKVLRLDWSEVHDEAEELEHAVSDKLLERIDELLGHPSVDPHGDPIPTAAGTVAATDPQASLASCPLNRPVHVVRVLDQDTEFLQFADQNGLRPGTRWEVSRRDDAADAVQLSSPEAEPVTLGTSAARKILVEIAAPAEATSSGEA